MPVPFFHQPFGGVGVFLTAETVQIVATQVIPGGGLRVGLAALYGGEKLFPGCRIGFKSGGRFGKGRVRAKDGLSGALDIRLSQIVGERVPGGGILPLGR